MGGTQGPSPALSEGTHQTPARAELSFAERQQKQTHQSGMSSAEMSGSGEEKLEASVESAKWSCKQLRVLRAEARDINQRALSQCRQCGNDWPLVTLRCPQPQLHTWRVITASPVVCEWWRRGENFLRHCMGKAVHTHV